TRVQIHRCREHLRELMGLPSNLYEPLGT
ncbi:hypothetical protein D049_0015B, partial [Vibrio parahaemolyticus VPTS-2010]